MLCLFTFICLFVKEQVHSLGKFFQKDFQMKTNCHFSDFLAQINLYLLNSDFQFLHYLSLTSGLTVETKINYPIILHLDYFLLNLKLVHFKHSFFLNFKSLNQIYYSLHPHYNLHC